MIKSFTPALPDHLSPHDEEEWERFRVLLDYATGFWLAFIFSPSSRDAQVIRRRVAEILKADGHKRMDVLVPQSPDELRNALPWIAAKDRAGAGCVWLQALQVDMGGREERPWFAAWEHFFLRANGIRDALRRRLNGGLVIVAPLEMKPMVRDAAPDLWSVREIVLELTGQPTSTEAKLEPPPPLPTSAETAPDPEYWMEEAERREPGSEGRALALVQAGQGWTGQERWAQALVAFGAAAGIYSVLAARNPSAFRPLWMRCLVNLGSMQRILGFSADAQTSSAKAVEIARELVEQNLELYRADLATSLYNEGVALLEMGLNEAAVVPLEEAAKNYLLLSAQSDTIQASQAATLTIIAELRDNLGHREAALTSLEEAVAIGRRGAARNPDEFLINLAVSLNNLSILREKLGQREAALAACEEAVTTWSQVVRRNPEDFLRNLAGSLGGLVALQLESERYEAALASALALVKIFHELAIREPNEFLSNLALSISTVANILLGFEPTARGFPIAKKAFDIYWQLYQQDPEKFAERLRNSYETLSEYHNELGTPIDPEIVERMKQIPPPEPKS